MKQAFYSLLAIVCMLWMMNTAYADQTNPTSSRSFKMTFHNQANNKNIKHVYLVIKGSVGDKSCFIKITPNDQAISPCVPVTASTRPVDYAFDAVNDVTFRVPPLSSGRMYVSINKPLTMHINAGGTVAEPSVYDSNPVSNPDYKTMFDKVEFTYTESGSTFFNPTAVDFLSLPISVAQNNHVFGLTTDRETAFSQIKLIFDEEFPTHEYQRLFQKDNNVLLRILAPGRESSFFDGKYMDPYIDWLFNEYYYSRNGKSASHTLSIQLVEASGVIPGQPRVLTEEEGKFSGFVKNGETGKVFVLSNTLGDEITIKRASFTSNSLFMAAMGDMDVKIGAVVRNRIASKIKDPAKLNEALINLSNGYKAVTVKFITSAWAVGLLPPPNGDVIDQKYIREKIGTDVRQIYTERYAIPPNLKNRGPWYQLYGKAIHVLTPHLYAFPYDDVFGLDGTNAENDTYPAVVTLHSMTNSVVTPAIN